MTIPKLSPRHVALLRLVLAAAESVQTGALEQALQASRPTINRALRDLLACGFLEKLGDGRSTRYVATDAAKAALGPCLQSHPHQQGLAYCSGRRLPCLWSNRFARLWELAPR